MLAPLPHRESPADDARAVLGGAHPLVRALELRTTFARDFVAVVAFGAAVVLVTLTGIDAGVWPAAAVSGVLGAVFAVCALLAGGSVRERALELIADGREELPVDVVACERERLLADNRRRRLAGSLARMRREAQQPSRWTRHSALPLNAGTLTAADAELREIERLLLEPQACAHGVALVRRLLVDGGSPLRREDPQRLREELRRAAVLLATPRRL